MNVGIRNKANNGMWKGDIESQLLKIDRWVIKKNTIGGDNGINIILVLL